jgi:hypothetical protein
MSRWLALWVLFAGACGSATAVGDDGGGALDGGGGGDDGGGSDGGGPPSEGLLVVGNRIVHADGSPFHGRGADLHDERSCEACSFLPRNPNGVDRWSDELIDHWHANFIRFLLSAKAAPYNMYELQWQSLVDDMQYLADIIQNVDHMTGKGAYVLVTLFADPTIKPDDSDFDSEWPSSLGDSNSRYATLAEAFHDNPRVLFGLTNEPHTQAGKEAALADVYQNAIAAIRAVEDMHGSPHHIVIAQAPIDWARDVSYFMTHPLQGDQIAYEIHPYNQQTDFDMLIVQPSKVLPIIIGEYGPAAGMTDADIMALWSVAQANEVPYIGWVFHQRCPPNLLQDTASDGCGLDPATGYDFPRTAWGDLLFNHLATPW